jgi:hypothetical protein
MNLMSNAFATAVINTAAEPAYDPNNVTPGVIGFVATFFVAAAVVLIAIDMVRRVRRVNYRAEARTRLEAEAAAAAAGEAPATTTPAP